MDSVVLFGSDELANEAVDALALMGAEIAGLVVPWYLRGPRLDLLRSISSDRGINLLVQPRREELGPFVETLQGIRPDVIVVWSFPMILPPAVINTPRLGCVNLHGGLLPQYRGRNVMQWAIINGENETGVALHYMNEAIDAGPIIDQKKFPIHWEDDAKSVREKLKDAGLLLLAQWWAAIKAGTAPRKPQDEAKAKYYPRRRPDDGLIDWSSSSTSIYNLVRALVSPWPGAFTYLQGQKIAIWRAVPCGNCASNKSPGWVVRVDSCGIRVVTGSGELEVKTIEVDGKLLETDGLRTIGISVGDIFGS